MTDCRRSLQFSMNGWLSHNLAYTSRISNIGIVRPSKPQSTTVQADQQDTGWFSSHTLSNLVHAVRDRRSTLQNADKRISFVTFLLPPSRKNLGARNRLGAVFVGEREYNGAGFLKFRLETE